MKRLYPSFLVVVGLILFAAPARAVSFDEATVIDSTPQGTLYDTYRTCHAWMSVYGFRQEDDFDALVGRIVVSDDALYIFNPCSQYDTKTWLKGDLTPDGRVTFHLPQCVVKNSDASDQTAWQLYFAYKMHQDKDAYGYPVCVAEPEGDVEFLWKDGTLTQLTDAYIGICRDGGEWLDYADKDIHCVPFDEKASVPSETAIQGLRDYKISYTNQYDEVINRKVVAGFDGTDFWMKGLYRAQPNWWIRGELVGNKIRVPLQYMGADLDNSGYYIYCMPATCKKTNNPSTGMTDYTYTAADYIEFTYFEDDGYMMSRNALLVNAGKSAVYYADEVLTPELEPIEVKAATPADPVFKNYIAFMPLFGDGFVSWYIPCKDTEGNFLDPDCLFWRIYVDDDTEPYELLAEDYPNLTEDITDIPYEMSFDYGGPVYCRDEVHEFMFLFEGARGIGAQSVYKAGGEVRCSNTVYWGKTPENSVTDAVAQAPVVATEYYDLSGRRIATPSAGLYIAVSRRADGTHTTSKQIVK